MKRKNVDHEALLTRDELARRWLCSTKSVDRLVAAGALRALRIGRLVRFTREAVDAAEKAMSR